MPANTSTALSPPGVGPGAGLAGPGSARAAPGESPVSKQGVPRGLLGARRGFPGARAARRLISPLLLLAVWQG